MNFNVFKYVFVIGIAVLTALAFSAALSSMADHAGIILMLMPAVMLFALSFVISPLNVIYWILAVRIPISPVLESTRVFGGMGPGALLNLIVILGAVVICFHNFKKIKQIPFVRSWLFFLLITFVSILYSSEKMIGIRLWLNNMTYLSMLCIALTCISSLKDIRRWMLMFAASAAVSVLIAFAYAAAHGMLTSRIYYPLTHPSILAHYTVIMITITATTLMFLVERGSPVRHFLRLTIALLAMALLLTQTRNAWIACWFSFLVFGFMRSKKLVIAVCIGIPMLLAFLPPVQERIMDAFHNQHQSASQGMNSFAWRLTVWSDSIPWIVKKPLFGYGLSTFKPSSTIFSKVAQVQGSGAHNVYIELLFETGIIGLFAYLSIYFILIRQILFYYKHLKDEKLKGIAAMVLVYVVGYLIVCSIDNLQQVLVANWYVWFFIGATYRYFQISYEKQNLKIVP